jgi:hypothetical protein
MLQIALKKYWYNGVKKGKSQSKNKSQSLPSFLTS